MIRLEAHAQGTILPVRAHPGARRNRIRGEHDGALRVSVTAAPEKGKANKAIIELLAEAFGLRKGQIELLAGETSTQKRFLLSGIGPDEVGARLGPLLNPEP